MPHKVKTVSYYACGICNREDFTTYQAAKECHDSGIALPEYFAGVKQAMLARDTAKVGVLRALMADFTNELVSKRRMPQDLLADEEALEVIKRAVKKRLDSASQFKNGGRPELAEAEEAEIALIKPFLPQMMSQDEIRPIAEAKKAEMGITDKAKAGQLMGAIIKELKGKADGVDVKIVVDSLFG